jgi:hypothetical protein
MGSTAGQASAFGLSELSALRQYGISGALRQPSESTHAMVNGTKKPRASRTRTGQQRARAGGQEIARQRQCRIVPSLNANAAQKPPLTPARTNFPTLVATNARSPSLFGVRLPGYCLPLLFHKLLTVLSHQLDSGGAMFGRPAAPHAAVAARHVRNASSLRMRSVRRDVRWRWTLNVL